MKVFRNKILAAVLFAAVAIFVPGASFASLAITPTLVVIEGRQRFADVNLINNSSEVKTYEVTWRFYAMEEAKGNYLVRDKSVTDFDLTQNIVFTPRRVTLQPGELQKIRLALRLKGEPPALGDYRGHLQMKETGEKPAIEPLASGDKKTKIGIDINLGFSIPVVYRVGEPDAKATIGDVKTRINEKTGKIEALISVSRNSDSKFGLMGSIRVFAGDQKIGEQQNANIFPEANSRIFVLPLSTQKLPAGKILRIVYEDYRSKDKRQVLAEKSVPVTQ